MLWDSNPKPLSANKLTAKEFSVFKTGRLIHGPTESQEQNSEATLPVLPSKNHRLLMDEHRYFQTYAFPSISIHFLLDSFSPNLRTEAQSYKLKQ